MPLQGDRRADMNTQGECPGLGASAPSGREGNCSLWLAQSLYQRIYRNMKKEQEHILATIRKCLANNMPASGKAILFGSQARGTARDDSDWDILIILDKEELLPSDYDNVTYPLTELGWELGKEINPVMYSAREWLKYKNTSFCKNVEKEGIRL